MSRAAPRLQYDPNRGTFRSWLYTVTRNKMYNFLESRKRRPRGTGDSSVQANLEAQPDPNAEEDDAWDREYERRTFAWAAERVKTEFQPSTWAAFWQTAVEGKNAKDVGGDLKMSPGAVYVAKSRVLARIREEVQTLQED